MAWAWYLKPLSLLTAIAVLAPHSASDAATGPSADLIKVTHLTGPIYVVEDENIFSENSVFYVGPTTVTLIGTGWSPEIAALIDAKIKVVTHKPVSEVVDTDFNPERAGGNAYWQRIGAQVISTTLTDSLLRQKWATQAIETRAHFPDYPDVPLSLPTKTYSGDFTLQNGEIQEFYIGPSHTVDDIFVYFPTEHVLYAGNILKEQVGNLAQADLPSYVQTLHKLKNLHLNIKYIIAGHWSPVHGPELIDTYLGFLHTAMTSGQ
jgi:metallo-beta-lactamase class B